MLRDLNTCKRCSQAQNCTTFHKATEQGDGKTSGLGSFFEEKTDHMSKTYVNYFTNWYKLVCLEGKEMEQKRNQREIWCLEGWEREKLGRCFSNMVLKPHDRDSVVANSHYCRQNFERCVDHPSVTPLQDVPIAAGERVILSEENNGAIALAAGESSCTRGSYRQTLELCKKSKENLLTSFSGLAKVRKCSQCLQELWNRPVSAYLSFNLTPSLRGTKQKKSQLGLRNE